MASRSKPLISAAALASAAAIAVATPAVAPNLGMPTPAALSKAAYELTTFADVLSVPPEVWTDLLFGNTDWGGTLGYDDDNPDQGFGPEWARPQNAFGQPFYVNPWVGYCNFGCTRTGIAGVTYLFLDALINGNGNGFDDVENWPIGIVNYFAEPSGFFPIGSPGNSPQFQFENLGYSAATWYILQGTLGQAVPELAVPLAAFFWGELNVTVGYNLVLSTVAQALQVVPVVGQFAGNSIFAYLGDLPIDPENPSLGLYQYGLSGVLNYWIDIATGAVPFPGVGPVQEPTPPAEAASLAAADVVAEADSAKVASVEVAESTPVDVPESAPVAEAPVEVAPVAEAPAAEAPVAEAPVEVTDAAPAVEAEAPAAEIGEVTPEVEAEPVDAPEAPAVSEPDLDIDIKDLADLDVVDDAAADAPTIKGSLDDAADSGPAAGPAAADADSAADSGAAGDSAGSDSAGSDSAGSDSDSDSDD